MFKLQNIFLVLFVSLLAVSSLQYFLLEQDDLDGISLVEEQQETNDQVTEIFGLSFEEFRFRLFSSSLGEDQQESHFVVHLNKQYPNIHIPVPKSPPELS